MPRAPPALLPDGRQRGKAAHNAAVRARHARRIQSVTPVLGAPHMGFGYTVTARDPFDVKVWRALPAQIAFFASAAELLKPLLVWECKLRPTELEPAKANVKQVLVETAMFAAVGGLAFSVAAVLKLQSYLGYLLPMPIVLSAMRSGPSVARKSMVATAILLFVLLGPLQAVSYVLQHGFPAWALGCLWALQTPWWISILLASVARLSGIIGFLTFTSWTLNENLYRLLVTQVYSLLDQMGSLIGASGSPSTLVIQAVMASVLLVNCLMYVALLHVLYAILLRSMGYKAMRMPAFLENRLLPTQLHSRQQ